MEDENTNSIMTDDEASLQRRHYAASIIMQVAAALQKYVYVKEDGDPNDPNQAILCGKFVDVNNDLLGVAGAYGVQDLIAQQVAQEE